MQSFNAPYLNIESLFYLIFQFFQGLGDLLSILFSSSSWAVIQGYAILIEIIFVPALFYSIYQLLQVRKRQREAFLNLFKVAVEPGSENEKGWEDITGHLESENEAQWKLAIIDADKVLEDALKRAGYLGVGVGELLKDAEGKHGFRSLQEAWEAHKVRNRIAHEAGFELTKREARRAVELYKQAIDSLLVL
ncbi:MAG: hypothetical protein HZA94_01385 [Candidatus Vogelbacteria bacterium]|nr:hypothetical protein [Candidatus Vogelbacteria bacterium]